MDDRGIEDLFPGGAIDPSLYRSVQAGFGAHPAPYTRDGGGQPTRGKEIGA
jgi:hypothetical protein